jgi:hypothetical protein
LNVDRARYSTQTTSSAAFCYSGTQGCAINCGWKLSPKRRKRGGAMYPACNLGSRSGNSSCEIPSRTRMISTLRKILDACRYETQTLPLYTCAVYLRWKDLHANAPISTRIPVWHSVYHTCSSCGEQRLIDNCLLYNGFVACSAKAMIANLVVGRDRTDGGCAVLRRVNGSTREV